MVGFDISWILSGLLLIPYLIWGVYTLRERFQYGSEFPPLLEVLTLVGLVPFYCFEYYLLKAWMGNTPALFYLALVGLFISGVALFGHMLVSLGTYVALELISPSAHAVHEPNYHAGEVLELKGDFEGAAKEYQTVAAMFPKDPKAPLLVADNLVKVGDYENAVAWFERGLDCCGTSGQCLPTAFRLSELYVQKLNRPDAAREVLQEFLERFPDSEYADAIRSRLRRLDLSQDQGIE